MRLYPILLTVALGIAGCGSAVVFQSDPKVPNAEGALEATPTSTGSFKLAISVRGLPPPSEASSGASAYVVWIVPAAGGDPQRLGALAFDAKLIGKLEAETVFHNFRLFISPEESEAPQTPLGAHLMTTDVSR